jgi:hypothetical protein
MYTELSVWLDHFEYHAAHRSELPPELRDDLTGYERRLIAASLARFHRAERLEPAALLHAAEGHETEHRVAPLARIIQLLIAEEQQHARLLGAFMEQHGLAPKPRGWLDRALRRMRSLAGFESQLSVLITRELIAKVYLRALEAATGSRQLQALCRMLVADELAHIGFESELLRELKTRRGALARNGAELLRRAYFTASAVSAWFSHRAVLRAPGYRFVTFLRACSAQYAFYLEAPPLLPQRRAHVCG